MEIDTTGIPMLPYRNTSLARMAVPKYTLCLSGCIHLTAVSVETWDAWNSLVDCPRYLLAEGIKLLRLTRLCDKNCCF